MNRRLAPSVSYPVGPCVWWGGVLLAVWALAAAAVAWAVIRGGLTPWTVLLPAVAALPLLLNWRQAPSGTLRWDTTEGWSWQAAAWTHELPSPPQVVWRGRSLLLLRLPDAPSPLGWLWLERARDPGRWAALCRAALAA